MDQEKDIIRYNKTFERYRTARKVWEQRGYDYEEFIRSDVEGTGTQFTRKQLEIINKKYNIPLSINIGFAIKEQMLALLTAIDPMFDVLPVGESTKDFAYLWREILYATFKNNKTRAQIKKSLSHMVDVGHGVMRARPNRFYKRNSFNCVIECVRWNYCYFDPSSEDPLFEDCEMQFVAIPINKEKAKKDYNLTEEEVNQATTVLADSWNPYSVNSYQNMSDETNTIWILDIYEKVMATVYTLPDGTRTTKEPSQQSISPKGELVNGYIDSHEDVFIKYSLKIGNLIKYTEIMPISRYCLVPFVYTSTDSPYSIGLAHYVIDIYKAVNKAMALTLENTQKGGNSGLFAYEGSIVDRDNFEKTSSTPGGVIEIEANPALPNGGMPVQKQTNQFANGWFTIFNTLLDLAKYVSGILDLIQGSDSNAPETAGGTNALINQGSQRIKMHARSIDDSMEELCNLVIEYMQSYSPKENIITYVSDTEAYVKIKTDVEGAISQAGQQGLGFSPQQNGQQIATIVEDMTNKKIMAILGSPNVGEYKVHYKSSQNMPNTRMMANQIIISAMSRMQGDATAVALMKASLKLLDIPEIDKALKETDVTMQQAQQISQLQQELEKALVEAKKMEDKYYNEVEKVQLAEIGAKVSKAESKVEVELAKLKEGVKESNQKQKELQTNNN